MRTVYLTRKEHFNAAHKLWHDEWTPEKNFETFGKCANPNWHGHNFILYVTVVGKPSLETGFVVDLKKLSALIKKVVIEELDHKNLNLDVPFLKNVKPSTENIAFAIWDLLMIPIEELGGKLHCIKLCETENNYVEYYGER